MTPTPAKPTRFADTYDILKEGEPRMPAAAPEPADSHHLSAQRGCGCCGRSLPAGEIHELGNTPGVFICVGCALWVVRRVGLTAALRQIRFTSLGRWLHELRQRNITR